MVGTRLFSLLRPFRLLYSGFLGKKRLIPLGRAFRHKQIGRGKGKEKLHPDPEIIEGKSSNS